MKKTIKVILCTLILSLVCVFGVNAAESDSLLIIQKQVNVAQGAVVPKETYNFNLSAITVAPNTTEQGGKINVYTGIMTGLNTNYSVAVTTGNSNSVNVDFKNVKYTKAGIFRYLIKETAGTLSGMIYDNSEHELDVYVGTNDNGKTYVVERIIAYKKENGQRNTKSGVTGADGGTQINFTNSFVSQNFIVKNILTGSQADYNKPFTYKLTITADATVLPTGTQITAKKALQNGTTEDVIITVGSASTFTLAHNERLTVPNVPQNVKYSVVQTAESGYDTTNKGITDPTATSSLTYSKTMDNDGDEVTFTNDRSIITPTGIILNVMPFILLLIVGIMFIALKRKKEQLESK